MVRCVRSFGVVAVFLRSKQVMSLSINPITACLLSSKGTIERRRRYLGSPSLLVKRKTASESIVLHARGLERKVLSSSIEQRS